MKNQFTHTGIVQKIIIALIFLVIFNFVYPYIPVSFAADEDAEESLPGGILLEPLLGLISSLGEGVVWLMQKMALGMGTSSIRIDVADEGMKTAIAATLGALATGGTVAIGWILSPFTFGGSAVIGTAAAAGIGAVVAGTIKAENLPDAFYMPVYKISPQEIFSDQVPALHVNFINPETYPEENDSDDGKVYDSAKILGPQISKWYVSIRNMVLVGLMVVLLYIGIRIIISSTAGEKAKYKEHIKDWLIAVILVVFMHYIMAFALAITEYITNMLISNNNVIKWEMQEDVMEEFTTVTGQDISKYKEDGKYYFYTNLMGDARLKQQLETTDENGNTQFTWSYIGYTIIFLALVIYTAMFLLIYLKRVIYMAFLTMMAPLVALTYPIDKISDGKAQAFDMWIKEYVFNLLLQPFHLLLYTVLVGSVMDLAQNNMLYAIVALGFLLPAEKLLRKFFGFEKSSTAGSIVGGVVGGSLAMNAINKLGSLGSGKGKSGGSGKSSESDSSENVRLSERKADKGSESTDELFQQGFAGNIQEGTVQNTSNANANPNPNPRLAENSHNNEFNANEQLEATAALKDKVNNSKAYNWVNDKKMAANEKISNIKSGYNDWLAKTPKTALGRDAKKLAIRGARTAKSVAGTGLHYTGKAIKKVGKATPRVVTKAALAATMATAGAAAGIATGELENIGTYGLAAAGIGSKLGDSAVNVAGNVGKATMQQGKNIRQDYRERRYDKDTLEAMQNKEADKKWKKDKEVIKLYKEKFGEKDYKQAMENAMEYRRKGITDDKAIIGAQKLEGVDDTEKIATAKAATMVKSDKDMKAFNERLTENGIEKERIKAINKNIRKINKM